MPSAGPAPPQARTVGPWKTSQQGRLDKTAMCGEQAHPDRKAPACTPFLLAPYRSHLSLPVLLRPWGIVGTHPHDPDRDITGGSDTVQGARDDQTPSEPLGPWEPHRLGQKQPIRKRGRTPVHTPPTQPL